MNRNVFLTPGLTAAAGHGGAVYSRSILRLLGQAGLSDSLDVINVRGVGRGHATRIERVVNLARSLLSGESERVLSMVAPAGRRVAEQRGLNANGIAFFDHCEVGDLRNLFRDPCKRVFICHNIEHKLLLDRVALDGGLPRLAKPLLEFDARKLHTLELAVAADADAIWCISSRDAAWWRDALPDAHVVAVPPTFPGALEHAMRDRSTPGHPIRLGFLGALSWWPNAEAVDWLLTRVMPQLDGIAELHLFGGNTRGLGAGRTGVEVHGFVADIDEVWRSMDIFICPMFSGGGCNVKFAEAVFRGKPVLATRFAARGLPEVIDDAVVYSDDPHDWMEFLRSPRARVLASRWPTDGTRMKFADASYQGVVSSFLKTLIGTVDS